MDSPLSGGQASSLQRDNVALLRGRSNGCEKRLVSGNWRRKTERTTLDRNYVLCILLEQEQRCSSNIRASPSTSLFEHILFVRAVLWLTDFTGWTSTACQQTGPAPPPFVPPPLFYPPPPRPCSLPPCLILPPSAISPAPTPKHAASFSMLPPGKGRASNPEVLETH